MKSPLLTSRRAARLEEHATLQPDLARALRATIAFIGPVTWSLFSAHPHAAAFAAPAGLTLALTDLRGPYRERFAIALTMSAAMIGASVLGVLVADSLPLAVLAMGGVALLGGLWRHLSADYGPALTSATALLFLLGLAVPGGWAAVPPLLPPLALGCALAMALQMAAWFTRPQHPIRAAVAEVWVAVADLLLTLRPEPPTVPPAAPASVWDRLRGAKWFRWLRLTPPDSSRSAADVPARERALRTALDRAIDVLARAGNRRQSALLTHLTVVRQTASRLAAWGEAFAVAREAHPAPACDALVDALLTALSTLARAVAVAVVSHRPRHFAAVAVRVQRCLHLARVLDEQLLRQVPDAAAHHLLDQLNTALPALRDELSATPEFAAGAASALRRVTYLRALSPRSLTAWVNDRPKLDAVIVRHTLRMVVLTMAAVAAFKFFAIPRGNWIALTILVVLQPDYGATRQRAGNRIGGTVAGALVASVLLWLPLPRVVLLLLATAMALCFAYWVRKNYRWAVFFVTVMLVLITEASMPVTLELPLMRLGATLTGGAVALLAALFLWPSWEKMRYPALLAAALRANATYLSAVVALRLAGRPLAGDAVVAKRAAETANSEAGASLERMLAEPASRHPADVTQAGALLAYSQRLTRAVTLLAVQLRPGPPEPDLNRPLRTVTEAATAALGALADAVAAGESGRPIPPVVEPATVLDAAHAPDAAVLAVPLGKAITEIRAMTLAVGAE